MATQNYGKTLYNQISDDIKTYSKNIVGVDENLSLKDIICTNKWGPETANEFDYIDKASLCISLEEKYNIAVSDENLKKLDNLEKLASCVCGLILSKNLQRK